MDIRENHKTSNITPPRCYQVSNTSLNIKFKDSPGPVLLNSIPDSAEFETQIKNNYCYNTESFRKMGTRHSQTTRAVMNTSSGALTGTHFCMWSTNAPLWGWFSTRRYCSVHACVCFVCVLASRHCRGAQFLTLFAVTYIIRPQFLWHTRDCRSSLRQEPQPTITQLC